MLCVYIIFKKLTTPKKSSIMDHKISCRPLQFIPDLADISIDIFFITLNFYYHTEIVGPLCFVLYM